MYMKIKKTNLISFASFFSALMLWEVVGRLKIIDPTFISYPSEVFAAGAKLIANGSIFSHFLSSMEALSAGLILGIIAGVSGGILIASSKLGYRIFKPHIFILSFMPMVALMPLIIIWFGVGIASKIAIVFLMSLVPILINTISGVHNTDTDLLKMARSFGADNSTVIRTVIFFDSLPFIFSGIRVAIGRAVIGIVIAEVIGYGRGLGYLISFYGGTFQTARLMFVIVVLLAISLGTVGLLTLLEKAIIKWKK